VRFPAKALESLRVLRYVIGEELQGDGTAQIGVLGLINDAHSAATKLFGDAVVRDGLADHAQRCYGGSEGKSMKAVELAVSQKNG
jgi:hypothetical protein